MATIPKGRSTAPNIPSNSAQELITTGAWAIALILVFAAVGVVCQYFFGQQFLGQKTQLIHMCKNNPKVNPEACAELLEARTTARNKTKSLPGVIPSAKFGLSDDRDADLRPPPDLVR